MMSQPITTAVRRSNRNRIIWGGILAAIVIGTALFNLRYLTNFFSGPRSADRSELLALTNPDAVEHNWVAVTGDQNFDTGMQMVSKSSKTGTETVESNYRALLLDKRLLLIKTPESADVKDYTGALVAIPSEIQSQVVDYVETDQDVKGAFLPYMLDADDFRTNGYIGLGVGGLTLLASLFLLTTGIQRGNSGSHPVFKRLARHGDTAVVSSEIESEMLVPRWSSKNVHITQNWLVQANSADFNAMKLNELSWMYKQVTQRRVNGIPAGKTFAAHIFDHYGHKIEVVAKNEDEAHTILESIHNAAPWAFIGYNEELNKAWQKDRAAVITAVEQRRQAGVAAADA